MDLWASFSEDIDHAIRASMEKKGLPLGTKLTVGNLFKVPTRVQNEDKLRSHIDLELNAAAEGVLAALGTKGSFTLPGAGNAALIGDPDLTYVEDGSPQPKFSVRCISSAHSTVLINLSV